MAAVVFDANGTLFDLSPVANALGGEDHLEAFFQRLLQSAATVTFAGAWVAFEELAENVLATTCARVGLSTVDQSTVLEAMKKLPPYPDAAEAVNLAGAAAILTNSSAHSARQLVEKAGLDIHRVLSCEEVRAYKPAPAPYHLARERLGECVLVAAHAWDVVGARAAGLRAIWVSRTEQVWPFPGIDPGESAGTLVAAVSRVT